MFVENESYEEAEKFCLERPGLESKTLMTILWTIYINKYQETQ